MRELRRAEKETAHPGWDTPAAGEAGGGVDRRKENDMSERISLAEWTAKARNGKPRVIFAELCGLDGGAIQRIEDGGPATPGEISALAGYFDLSAEELLSRVELPKERPEGRQKPDIRRAMELLQHGSSLEEAAACAGYKNAKSLKIALGRRQGPVKLEKPPAGMQEGEAQRERSLTPAYLGEGHVYVPIKSGVSYIQLEADAILPWDELKELAGLAPKEKAAQECSPDSGKNK